VRFLSEELFKRNYVKTIPKHLATLVGNGIHGEKLPKKNPDVETSGCLVKA
jgi:hypothetical protein